MSQVVGKRPDLFTAYLHVSSQWDGAYETIVEHRLPVYFAIGRNDDKEHSYFTERNMSNEHGGGGLFAMDEEIMGWLFEK